MWEDATKGNQVSKKNKSSKTKTEPVTETATSQFDHDIPIPPKAAGGRKSKIRDFLSGMPVGGSTVVPKSQSGNWRTHAKKLGFKIVTRPENTVTGDLNDADKHRIWRTE